MRLPIALPLSLALTFASFQTWAAPVVEPRDVVPQDGTAVAEEIRRQYQLASEAVDKTLDEQYATDNVLACASEADCEIRILAFNRSDAARLSDLAQTLSGPDADPKVLRLNERLLQIAYRQWHVEFALGTSRYPEATWRPLLDAHVNTALVAASGDLGEDATDAFQADDHKFLEELASALNAYRESRPEDNLRPVVVFELATAGPSSRASFVTFLPEPLDELVSIRLMPVFLAKVCEARKAKTCEGWLDVFPGVGVRLLGEYYLTVTWSDGFSTVGRIRLEYPKDQQIPLRKVPFVTYDGPGER